MQGLMFRCRAGCCEDSQASMRQVYQCTECCHAPLAQAQALVTSKSEKFQDRLAGCTMHCSDKAKDAIAAGRKGLQGKRQLESWMTRRVDEHMNPPPPNRDQEGGGVALGQGEIEAGCWPSGQRAGIYLKRGMGLLGL
uniref:Protein FAM136A n=1 Tax=Sus scrofa TaxID=9823 RepID=A0A8D0UKA4_PIG